MGKKKAAVSERGRVVIFLFLSQSLSPSLLTQASDSSSGGEQAGREVWFCWEQAMGFPGPAAVPNWLFLSDSMRSFETSLVAEDHSLEIPLVWWMCSPTFCLLFPQPGGLQQCFAILSDEASLLFSFSFYRVQCMYKWTMWNVSWWANVCDHHLNRQSSLF